MKIGAFLVSAALGAGVAVAASQASALDTAVGSSVTVLNRTHQGVNSRVKTVEDEQWDVYAFEPDEEAVLDCGGCMVDGFEMMIGAKPHHYFLKSGKSYAIKFDDRRHDWVVYEARPGSKRSTITFDEDGGTD